MHFYELHEGDNDVFADLLLAREDEMEADEFFELVQDIRRRVMANYEHDTLIEAIADELEREHEFVTVSDDRLTAAVNVSKFEDDNFLADLDAEAEESDAFDDDRTRTSTASRGTASGAWSSSSSGTPTCRRTDPAVAPATRPRLFRLLAEEDLHHVAVVDAVGLAL